MAIFDEFPKLLTILHESLSLSLSLCNCYFYPNNKMVIDFRICGKWRMFWDFLKYQGDSKNLWKMSGILAKFPD